MHAPAPGGLDLDKVVEAPQAMEDLRRKPDGIGQLGRDMA